MSKEIIPSPGGSNKFSRLISKIKAALGIVEESNTATHAIAAGKYVTWKGDLYKAKSAISSGATLSSSNLQAVPDGGLNELSEQIGSHSFWKSIVSSWSAVAEIEQPSNYFEILFTIKLPSGNTASIRAYKREIDDVSAGGALFILGSFSNGDVNNIGIYVNKIRNTYNLFPTIFVNGDNVTANCTQKVYYRV